MRDTISNKSAAPKLAKSIYRMALDVDIHLSFDDQYLVTAPFTSPEYYPDGFAINIHADNRRYRIICEGEARMNVTVTDDDGVQHHKTISEYEDFRALVPDVEIDALRNNKWFALYEVLDDDTLDFQEHFLHFDIVEAVNDFIDNFI